MGYASIMLVVSTAAYAFIVYALAIKPLIAEPDITESFLIIFSSVIVFVILMTHIMLGQHGKERNDDTTVNGRKCRIENHHTVSKYCKCSNKCCKAQ
ncbi:hypothetical protein CWI42_041820 [Ordospora colligata]|nr:hypothetical protein CWI41_041820 [Ordospora colligata]TBU16368.1 hypothetical protein CWI40_041820 [Ordospora colligata]TBU19072.1 hypothetical protein CWI42_041820 [Ordospora colligata]